MLQIELIKDGHLLFSGEKFSTKLNVINTGRLFLDTGSLVKSAWKIFDGQVTLCGHESNDAQLDNSWRVAIAKSNAVRLCGEEGNKKGILGQTVVVKQPGKLILTFLVRTDFYKPGVEAPESELQVKLGGESQSLISCDDEWRRISIKYDIKEIFNKKDGLPLLIQFSCGPEVIPPFAPVIRDIELMNQIV